MSASDLSYALHGLWVVAVLLLAFHLGWRRYAIDRGRADIHALRDIWWDLINSNSEWHRNAACRAFTRLLERLAEDLPGFSLGLALTILLTRPREARSSTVSEAVTVKLPDSALRLRARAILDAALVSVGATMLRQSVLALSLTLLLTPVGLVWAMAITVRHGWAGLASLADAVPRRALRFVIPVLRRACTACVSLAAQEWGAVSSRSVLRVVER